MPPKPLPSLADCLLVSQIAETLGVDTSTVYRIAEARGIEPVAKVGNARVFAKADLERFQALPMGRPRGRKTKRPKG